MNTNSEPITPTMVIDNSTITLSPFQTAARGMTEYAVNQSARLFSLRLTGDVDQRVELFGVEMDVYVPGEKK
jgi:hypothetical protein